MSIVEKVCQRDNCHIFHPQPPECKDLFDNNFPLHRDYRWPKVVSGIVLSSSETEDSQKTIRSCVAAVKIRQDDGSVASRTVSYRFGLDKSGGIYIDDGLRDVIYDNK